MASILEFGERKVVNARNPTESILLKDLWETEPCALFFLRRLGCPICRAYIQMVEQFREEYESKGMNLVCLSFEAFGEGSDFDNSFTKYAFWKGDIYTIDKSVYQELFGRKGFFDNFYGLLDIDKKALENAKQVPGNMKGDGFQLGGQFVVYKGSVKLEHRQKLFGDDAKLVDIFTALESCLTPKASPKA